MPYCENSIHLPPFVYDEITLLRKAFEKIGDNLARIADGLEKPKKTIQVIPYCPNCGRSAK